MAAGPARQPVRKELDGKAKLMRDDYCGGLEYAAKKALQASGKFIPWQVVTISIDAEILDWEDEDI